MNQHKLVAFVLTSILFLPLLCCGGHDADEKYFLISANIKIPYWEMAGAGLSQAASDLKVRSKFNGPGGSTPKPDQQALKKPIQKKAPALWISLATPLLTRVNRNLATPPAIPASTSRSTRPST